MLLFISDLHLDEQRPDITAAFLEFLAHQATKAKALYILGDLFEVWIGDDGMDSYQQGIARALKQLSARGISIFVLHGNRDFMLGQAFCRAAGCQLLAEETVIHIGEQRALLMHGDTLCTQDVRYLRKRRQLRNPISLWILRHLPLNYRQRLARNLRAASRQHTRLQPADIVDVTPEAVTQRMRQHRVQLLIHGHTHRPAVHSLQIDGQECQRIVLGDWDRQAWILVAQKGQLHPLCIPLPQQANQAANAPL